MGLSLKTTFLAFIFSVTLISCEESPVSPAGTVSFSRDIQPIFANNCTFPGCHNSLDRQGGIDLTSWNSVMYKGSNFGAEIVPFNGKWSHLVQHINRDTNISLVAEPVMPKPNPPYTNGQLLPVGTVKTIMRWIDEGAMDDNGNVAYDRIQRKAFIGNQSADYVAVVNTDNNFLVRYIQVGERNTVLDAPHTITVDNQGAYFYVTLIQEYYIEKFDAVTYQKVGRMPAGASPAHVVITNNGAKGYFTNFDLTPNPQRFIKVFDTGTMTVTDTIYEPRLNQPHGLRLTVNDSILICATEGTEFVYFVNASDHSILGIVPVDPTVPPTGNGSGGSVANNHFVPYQVAITPDSRYTLVSCYKSNDVRVFDIQAMSMIQVIPVGLYPLALDISPDGRWCYVPNRNSNSVTVIDMQSRTVLKTIPDVGVQPHQVDFTEDGHFAYVSCESRTGTFVHHATTGSNKPGTTAVIDVWNGHTKTVNIEMASFPTGVAITPGRN